MAKSKTYPKSVGEVIDPGMKFKSEAVRLLKHFKGLKPWRGTITVRVVKFQELHDHLCEIYGIRPHLRFGRLDGKESGMSSFNPNTNEIILRGKLSVITYLHEFAHAMGRDEFDACKWSINLFGKCFPEQYVACTSKGHMLVRNKE
jgi:hypothetical protein